MNILYSFSAIKINDYYYYSTLGVTTHNQFSYPLSPQMKFRLLLVRWMLASLLALTVYLLLF